MWLKALRIIIKIIAVLILYAIIVSAFKNLTSSSESIISDTQQTAPPITLLRQNQNPSSGTAFSNFYSHIPYLSFFKKYISDNYKEIEQITNIIFDTLQSLIPQTWLSSILGGVYFVFTFVVGGGFNYFNRNLKELSQHKGKIQRGVDLQEIFEIKSHKLMKSKGKQMMIDQYKQHFPGFDTLIKFLTTQNKNIKMIQSTRRCQVSRLIYTYFKQSSNRLKYSYLNLNILPFNHQSMTKNAHMSILDDIVYGNLYMDDRGFSLLVMKSALKLCKRFVNKVWEVLTNDWMKSYQFLIIVASSIAYVVYSPISIVLIIFFIVIFFIKSHNQNSKVPSQLYQNLQKPKTIILDNFDLLQYELVAQNQTMIYNSFELFEQLIGNLIHLAHNENINIIIITQSSLFFQERIEKACNFNQLKTFQTLKINQIKFDDALYLSTYFSTSERSMQSHLLWCNDVQNISKFTQYDQNKGLFERIDQVLNRSFKNLDQAISKSLELKYEIKLMLQIVLKFSINEKVNTKISNNSQTTRQINQILNHLRSHIKLFPKNINTEKIQDHLKTLKSLITFYHTTPIDLKGHYFLQKTKEENQRSELDIQKMYSQTFHLLNERQILYQAEFYSKEVCISTYLWLLKTF